MYRIQEIASNGLFPIEIAQYQIPICQWCIYGSMTRQAWRIKSSHDTIKGKTSVPGEHVAVDQYNLSHQG
jgi:hypothetical protein